MHAVTLLFMAALTSRNCSLCRQNSTVRAVWMDYSLRLLFELHWLPD